MSEIEELARKVKELEAEIKKYRQDFLAYEVQASNDNKSHPPVGSIVFLASENTPNDKYILCDGQALSRDTYKDLFLVIGTTWGAGDGSTTFNIPDLRGVFPRFLDMGAGRNLRRELGILEAGTTCLPNAPFSVSTVGNHAHKVAGVNAHSHGVQANGNHAHTLGAAGQHNHSNGAYSHLLSQSGNYTVAGNLDSSPRQPDLNTSKPMSNSGNHTHSLGSAGNHSHSLDSAGSHTHSMDTVGDHSHSISGGDEETRPINHALVGFIRVA
ncbi:microcystin-dependent protein [Leptolyngbya sp. PCC 7375]|nr:microcystin-dependent protein [Leptolyngbya sp. PCC 7375]